MTRGKNTALKMFRTEKQRPKKRKTPYKNRHFMANGVVENMVDIEARQPNSAIRKCVKIRINRTNKPAIAFVPYEGGRTLLKPHDEVTVVSIGGPKSRSKGDLGKALFKVIKINGVSLKEKFLKKR